MTQEDKNENETKNSFACPLDRDWIKKLLLKHSAHPNNGRALVVAPMVDQSDYPMRLLCRKYGANLTFTPMIHASLLTRSPRYREQFIPREQHPNDRPLIAQLCGHEPEVLEEAAKMVLPYVDGIDLNCGCPQGIAKRGFYGAFLLEEEEILLRCVRHLTRTINKPVSVKVRLLYNPEDKSIDADKSIELYTKLVDAGIHLLTVHGRTRHQLHVYTGCADWSVISQVVRQLGPRIPIFANGNIGCCADVERCFKETGVDGVMSSEAILEYPALFAGDDPLRRIGRIQLAREYLHLAEQYPPEKAGQGSGIKCLKAHIHRFLHPDLENGGNYTLRRRVAEAQTIEVLWDIVDAVERAHSADEHKVEEETLSWYMRHRITVTDVHGNEMTSLELKHLHDKGSYSNKQEYLEEEEEAKAAGNMCVFYEVDGEEDGDY